MEMGESLFYSWLRHVKGCKIVQMNWRPSKNWEQNDFSKVKKIVDVFCEHGYEDIFPKKRNGELNYEGFLHQTEIDVLGIDIDLNTKTKYYAVEVAFHEGGLNYGKGSAKETKNKVISKLIRDALCLYAYLNIKDADIIFATPKAGEDLSSEICKSVDTIKEVFTQYEFGFEFSYISDENFNRDVLNPILTMSANIADTSELFMRSFKLVNMFNDKEKGHSVNLIKHTSANGENTEIIIDGKEIDIFNYKLLSIINSYVVPILRNPNFPLDEYNRLKTDKVFGASYPFMAKERIVNGDSRYYANKYSIKNEEVFICSEIVRNKRNFSLLAKWIEKYKEYYIAPTVED